MEYISKKGRVVDGKEIPEDFECLTCTSCDYFFLTPKEIDMIFDFEGEILNTDSSITSDDFYEDDFPEPEDEYPEEDDVDCESYY